MNPTQAIAQGASAMGLALPDGALPRLVGYLELLNQWNRAFNLTAVRDPSQMVTRHLLDSLSLVPWIRPGSLLDVGSGGGLPGIPLALAIPGLAVTLLDSNGKKTRFLQQAVIELGLDTVSVVKARAENYRPAEVFDQVVCRAFSDMSAIWSLCAPLCRPDGRILAMKGAMPEAELASLAPGEMRVAVHPVTVPGLEGQRHIIELARETGSNG